MKKWRCDGWSEWSVDGTDGGSAVQRTEWVGIGEISAWLTERSRELIPETMGSVLEGRVCYSSRRWCRCTSECDQRWRESAARRMNCDEVMQIWRLGGCENFVGKWKELVFSAHSEGDLCWSRSESEGRKGRVECHCHLRRGDGLENKRKWQYWEEWRTWRRVKDQGQSLVVSMCYWYLFTSM